VASRQFNPDAQTASFKTVTSKALAKVIKALEEASDPASAESKDASPAKNTSTSPGNKSKCGAYTASPSTKRKATPKSTARPMVDEIEAPSDEDIDALLGRRGDY
jgi:hypothetical protein